MIVRDLGGERCCCCGFIIPIRKTLEKSAVALSERQNDG